MKNITYLLGAGASAGAIPVLNKMRESIVDTLSFLEHFQIEHFNPEASKLLPEKLISRESQKVLKEIIKDFNWLIEESGDYYTIDTLAKKYYLSNSWNEELVRLKRCLVVYFTINQFVKNKKIDKRYMSFIASIANRNDKETLTLNENIKILTWNYDLQFELALQKFTNQRINQLKGIYNIYPNQSSDMAISRTLTEIKKFGCVKLNGNAVWEKVDDNSSTIYDWDNDEERIIYGEKGLKEFTENERMGYFLNEYYFTTQPRYTAFANNCVKFINFAWELEKNFIGNNYHGFSNNHYEAGRIAEHTDILIVIGYSFPIFNRAIDNTLFEKMHNLEKIYVQDLQPEKIVTTMTNAFEIINKKNKENPSFFQKDDTPDQFIIPYEIATNL